MFCTSAKEYLSRQGIPFVDKDVSKDQAALEELTKLGYMTTPVIVVDDQVVVGFDRARLDKLLSEKR